MSLLPRRAARPAGPARRPKNTAGLLVPHAVEVGPRRLGLGDGVCRSFAVTGYPREVCLGWLAPLLSHPGRIDVALHIDPMPNQVAADRLRRQLARLESARRLDAAKGRLADPETDVAATDARDLAGRLARGEGKLFRLGLYLTVHAPDPDALESECARVRALVSSLLLDVAPATFRSLQGWVTTLPVGVDALGLRRTVDTAALAAAFPFTGVDLGSGDGVLYGVTATGSGVLCWDRFACDNHNAVILARSGAGKSYLAKLEALRSLYRGVQVFVVDPEDEYRRLADAVGGAYLHLGAPGVRLNPFDLAPGPDPLTRRALFIHTLAAVLLGGPLDPAGTAALDRAVIAAYTAVGISTDPRTHARPAPTLADLARTLETGDDPAAHTLALRLGPVRHRQLPRPVRRADHQPPRRPSRRDLAAGPARGVQGRRHPARPRRGVAPGLRPRPAPPPAGRRRRGVPAHARLRRRPLPVPDGEVGPQTLVRAHRAHPGRRRPARHRPRPGRRRQRRHPDPAPPGPAEHRGPRRGVRPLRRGTDVPPRRPTGRGSAGRWTGRPDRLPDRRQRRRARPHHHEPRRTRRRRARPVNPAPLMRRRTMSPTQPTPAPPAGPLTRWLRNPGATEPRWCHHLLHHLAGAAHQLVPLTVALLALVLTYLVIGEAIRAGWARHGRWVAIAPPAEPDPAGGLALWRMLHPLLTARRSLAGRRPPVAFECHADATGLRIGLWVSPTVSAAGVAQAVEAAWPGARAAITTPPRLPPAGRVSGGQARLAGPDWFPLSVDQAGGDPIRGLLSTLVGDDTGQAAVVAVLACPAAGRRIARAAGRPAPSAAANPPAPPDGASTCSTTAPPQAGPPPTPTRSPSATCGRSPPNSPAPRTSSWRSATPSPVRPVGTAGVAAGPGCARSAPPSASTPGATTWSATTWAARPAHWSGAGCAAGSSSPPLSWPPWRTCPPNPPATGCPPRRPAPSPRRRRSPMAERASRDATATAEPLHLLPAEHPGRRAGKPLGVADAGPRRPVALAVADARHHSHVIGATGSGKSTLLVNLILTDANAGRGVVVLDPKGDLVTDVLARLPADAGRRLVLLDPAETEAPAALNVLDTRGRDPELVVDQLVGVFHRLYAAYWGPRTEDVLRSACLTLTRRPGATLADVPLLLANPRYRATLTAGLSDPAGLGGFWSFYEGLTDAGQAQLLGPVMSKLRAVLTRRFATDLLGSAQSTFSLAQVLDGGILLARLPKGILGDDTTRLVGSLLLAGLWQAATARAALAEPHRADAAVYVDECQNFLHLPGSLDDVLAEARGYRLALTLAHQHLGQLPRDLADGVAANARNKVFFTVSPDDARVLARHVGPYLGPDDLAHLDRYQAACRLVVDGRDTTGFTLATRPAPAVAEDHSDELRAAARARGRGRAQRKADRLARRWTPATHEEGESGSPSIRASVSASRSPSVFETDGETDGLLGANGHVRGQIRPAGQESDS